MATSLNAVLVDPTRVAQKLMRTNAVFGLTAAAGRVGIAGAAVLDLTLKPLPALASAGYPVERVRIVIHPDHTVRAFPRGRDSRPFKHRYPSPGGDLCLQYDADDPALRWLPEDGLEELVTRVHRHLMAEEAWRRTGRWPFEDTPHGQPAEGTHPVTSRRTKLEARRWKR